MTILAQLHDCHSCYDERSIDQKKGAIGSVGGFLRISVAVWYVGMAIFLPWAAYFDNYTGFSQEELVRNTSQTVCNIFDILGIDFAREGDKAGDFQITSRVWALRFGWINFPKLEALVGCW